MKVVKRMVQKFIGEMTVSSLVTALICISMNVVPVYAISYDQNNHFQAQTEVQEPSDSSNPSNVSNPAGSDSYPAQTTDREAVYANDPVRQYPICLAHSIFIEYKNKPSTNNDNQSLAQSSEKIPAIYYHGNLVWEYHGDSSISTPPDPTDQGNLTFTQTKMGDTFLSFTTNSAHQQVLIGIDENGKVFLNKTWEREHLAARFTGPDEWEFAYKVQEAKQRDAKITANEWNIERYKITAAGLQVEYTYKWSTGGNNAPWVNSAPIHLDSSNAAKYEALIGKPVRTTERANEVLSAILHAEGLQATSVTFLDTDQSGNYNFSVWYNNFPHNVRTVTHDGYVVEDND